MLLWKVKVSLTWFSSSLTADLTADRFGVFIFVRAVAKWVLSPKAMVHFCDSSVLSAISSSVLSPLTRVSVSGAGLRRAAQTTVSQGPSPLQREGTVRVRGRVRSETDGVP